MDSIPPRVSEKIETDAIEAIVRGLLEAAGMTPLEFEIDQQERVRVTPNDPNKAEMADALTAAMRSRARMARDELARLKAAAALLRSYRAACGEHASTMVLVHRDEIDGVLG